MKFANWKDIAELIGITAIVASLIFVGLQMRQTLEIARNEDGYNRVANQIEANNAKFEHADIWLRGNAGEKLDRVDAMIYKELLRTAWNTAYWGNRSDQQLGISADTLIHDFAWFLHQNPGARAVWEDDAKERNQQRTLLRGKPPGPIAIQDIVRVDLEKLDQLKP
jgi:hypothetical protein